MKNIFVYIIFSLLIGFRPPLGTDYFSYYEIYQNIHSGLYWHLEPGFKWLMIFCKSLRLSFEGFLTIFAFLSLLPLYFLKEVKGYKLIFIGFITFYLFPYGLNAIRQFLTTSIAIYCIIKAEERHPKWRHLHFIAFLSSLIHITGILTILINLHYQFQKKINPYLYIIVVVLIILIFEKSFGEIITMRYGQIRTSYFQIAARIVTLFLLFNLKRIKLITNADFLIYMTGFLIYLLLWKYNVFATRLNLFFKVIEILVLLRLWNFKPTIKRNYMYKYLYLTYFVAFSISGIIRNLN